MRPENKTNNIILWRIMLLLCAFCMAMAASLAGAEGAAIDSDEALQEAFAGFRDSNTSEFQLTLTQDYYDEVSEGYFTGLTVQMLKAGISDYDLKYSFSGDLYYENVVWTTPHVAECASAEDVQKAVDQFLAEEAASFQLLFSSEQIYNTVRDNNSVYSYMAKNGVQDMQLRYTFSEPYVFYIDEIKPYSIPYAPCDSEDTFLQSLEYMHTQNANHFYIVIGEEFYQELTENTDLQNRLEACSQMAAWNYSTDRMYKRIEYTDVSWTEDPRIYCETEEGIVEAIRQMGASGIRNFNLVLTGELYDTVYDGYFVRLNELQAEAGMSESEMKYNWYTHVLLYENAVIHSDAVKLTTAEEAAEYVNKCVTEGRTDIVLFCTPELYTDLIGNISPLSFTKVGMSPIIDVIAQAGIFNYSFYYSGASSMIELRDCSYYPGTNIIKAVRNGDTSMLSDREKETMEAARRIADESSAADPLTTAKNIHDYLCAHVVYTDYESTDEDDTAIGAILNGQANCDGYADAFYLAGSLAGLNIRYQHGDSFSKGLEDFFKDVTHMWNLLEIDGTWRLVDVTWDDQEDRTVHTWFNLGDDLAHRMHIWNAETTVSLLPETDLSTRDENEYIVSTEEDMKNAVKDAQSKGYPFLTMICATEENSSMATMLEAVRNEVPASFTYSYNDHMLSMMIIF